ncbi:hypothetical protein B0H14DRAFT_2762356, partial [Mycena olivaceomarginata]
LPWPLARRGPAHGASPKSARIWRVSNRSIDFDLVGVDTSIANAFHRIIIAEVMWRHRDHDE